MKTIAIVDDDVYIGNMLEEALQKEGYAVLRAYSGTEALFLLSKHQPDIVLLDLMLPGLCGEEVLPKIRAIPVIIMSAKVSVDNKVQLLLDGAVDYVTKPFELKELLARIQVHLRPHATALGSEVLRYGDLCLDTKTHQVTAAGHSVRLTKTEFAILKYLMRNPNQVITKSQLLDQISADTPDCVESSLKVHVSNLRTKLREQDNKENIEAVWGIGFKLL
ncbi:MAG: response regulator transcription factor [Christensenella sp.]|uniref:response regulator transcription factor n=1 Tax=Christensenella sp. TaxID=1935934 RepID=UPI002B20D619|nr:response regulator transcription factor [Christensenella sp.]MEA5004298.1 response regulator transcription factor [Christensenella sp.]